MSCRSRKACCCTAAITLGLLPDELVVVGGLLQIRPRMVIQPEKGPMPTLTQAEADKPLPPQTKK